VSAETKAPEEDPPAGWGERIGDAAAALQRLIGVRLALFRAELSAKSSDFVRGAAGLLIALLFGGLALGLLAALVAALFTRLFGSAIAGILAAFLLYAAAAAAAAILGWNRFRRVRAFDYPVTSGEVGKDLEALRRTAPDARSDEEEPDGEEPPESLDLPARDLERRFREGSE